MTSIANNADHGRDQTLTYDPLNRILSAKSSSTSGADCWGQNFGPDGTVADDAVANLTKINNGTQTPPPCILGSLNATVDANNHINTDSTYAYDAAGNMTKDGSGTGWLYTFDAENRLTLAAGPMGGPYCYVYDGFGLRVAKKSSATTCSSGTVTKLYWRSISGDALAETDGSGSVTNAAYTEYVFFAGRRIASRNGSGGIFYYFADQLGSTRSITTGSGKNGDGSNQTPGLLCYDADFTPYGQEISYTSRLQTTACAPSYKFTGYERDPETGLDYAFARYYSSRLGRFLSTDPLGGSIGDLQSHNAYAYVANNPMNLMDPSGLHCVGSGWGGSRACPDGPDPGSCAGPSAACGGGCSLDGCGNGLGGLGCYLNGSPVSCNLLGTLLSNPSGSTVPCPPGGCPIGSQVIDGPNGTTIWQIWAPIEAVASSIIVGPYGNGTSMIATITWGWKTVGTGSDSSSISIWDFFTVPWSGTLLVPLVPFGPAASAGAGPTFAYNPKTDTGCYGLAAGAMVPATGRAVAVGPLSVGNLGNADNILAGGSVFVGGQATPALGVQGMGNSSGLLAGPTFGTFGVTAGASVSKCQGGVGKKLLNWLIDSIL